MKKKLVTMAIILAAALGTVSGIGGNVFASEKMNLSQKEYPATDETEDTRNVGINIAPIPTIKPVPGPSITPVRPDSDISDIDTNDDTDTDSQDVLIEPMYRLYNPNSGEHFYTANATEKNNLASIGWRYEGIGWYAPIGQPGVKTPVYRLYNKKGGEHHYTVSIYERRNLIRLGWRDEGVGWYSYEDYDQGNNPNKPTNNKRIPKTGAVPLYRQYNPNAYANNHNYTTSLRENNYLTGIGWRAEGIGWYGVKAPSPERMTKSGFYESRTSSEDIGGSYLTNIKLDGNQLILEGEPVYRAYEGATGRVFNYGRYSFALSSSARYSFNADDSETYVSREEFFRTAKRFLEASNGMDLTLTVRNGVVTSAFMAS